MSEKEKMINLLMSELAVSAVEITHAHIGEELAEKLQAEAEKFYNIYLMFDAVAGTVTPQERPF